MDDFYEEVEKIIKKAEEAKNQPRYFPAGLPPEHKGLIRLELDEQDFEVLLKTLYGY